ncbi:MAG: hypothetical protein HYU29_03430 [Chloroflexi bacterium]|nr:hypothetical protein [Chloroflexota bacterium]
MEVKQVRLEKQKLQLATLGQLSDQVREFCARASAKLNGFSFEDKHMALSALQVRVVVGKAGVKLFGVIPDSNATTARTWACMLSPRVLFNGCALGFYDTLCPTLASLHRQMVRVTYDRHSS